MTTPPEFDILPEQAGSTLAALLRQAPAGIPSGASWKDVKGWCTRGKVQVDGANSLDPARRMVAGERVTLRLDAPKQRPLRIELVHVDADVVVVDKPAGMLSVPARGRDPSCLAERTAEILARRERHRVVPLEVVHRIDRGTSGLLVFARTATARRHLKAQFAEHSTERRYRALTSGVARSAEHHGFLMEDRGDGLRGSWGLYRPTDDPPAADTREARTRVERLERLTNASLVQCTLTTGRQHQIRIHLSEAGTPLAGETVYIRDYAGTRVAAKRAMLHAASLGFTHPSTGARLHFESADAADFAALLARLRRLTAGRRGPPSPTMVMDLKKKIQS